MGTNTLEIGGVWSLRGSILEGFRSRPKVLDLGFTFSILGKQNRYMGRGSGEVEIWRRQVFSGFQNRRKMAEGGGEVVGIWITRWFIG